MSTHIPSNRTATVHVLLDGIVKNPVWNIDASDIAEVTPVSTANASHFDAIITPKADGPKGVETNVRFSSDALDDSKKIGDLRPFTVDEAPGNAVIDMSITVNS